MVHAQGRGYILQIEWSYILHDFGSSSVGYHHIALDKSSIPKTAFKSPFAKYEYRKVPFGLAQALAYFQKLMTGILKDFPFAITYLDDIIIFSKTPQDHLSPICLVFEKLKATNLSMKKSKCNFFSKEIQ